MLALDDAALERMRGGVASMIFQEPMLALDPVYTIGDQIAETVVRAPRRELGATAASARSRCWSACASPRRAAGSMPIRTRCRAACGSAR